MANLKEVRNRITSVSSTQQITKAMKMVSASKLRRAQDAITQIRPYANKLKEIIGQVAAASAEIKHPLLEAHENPRKAVVIVLTADRGLCGAFNSNLIKTAKALVAELKGKGRQLEFIVQGKKGIGPANEFIADKNHRDGHPAGLLFDFIPFGLVVRHVDFLKRNVFALQQIFRARAVGAVACCVDRYFFHRLQEVTKGYMMLP